MAREGNSDWLTGLFIGFGFGAAGVAGALAWVTSQIGAASIPIWAIAVWGAMMVFRGPFGKALSARVGGPVPDAHAELPQEVYAELDELRARVGELEERVDFSERLLTRANNAGSIPEPS
ncbi:MAG: hypothetical protein ACREL5_07305 [Gemmatimonadales bacterium]